MGQDDVKTWLLEKRLETKKFFSVQEISEAIGFGKVDKAVGQLYKFGYLDIAIATVIPFRYKYRIKDKYFDEWKSNVLITEQKTYPIDT